MIESRGFNYCSHCETGDTHPYLAPVGDKVSGKSRSEYTFFQCSICGHIWLLTENSAFGKHGHHYFLLSKPAGYHEEVLDGDWEGRCIMAERAQKRLA